MEQPDHESYLQEIFRDTDIPRRPIKGYVKGYHMIPYILVGPNEEEKSGSIRVDGKITVSPKLVIPVNPVDPMIKDIFEEDEPFMDKTLVTRTFSFRVPQQNFHRNVSVKGKQISIDRLDQPDREALSEILDKLNSQEILNTGVIWCPNPKFYPISLERFILSILEKEMGI